MTELTNLSATELRRLISRGTVSPRDTLQAVRARIDRLNPHLNAFVEMDWEKAEQAAVAAEALVLRGGDLPALIGIPVAIKESQDVAGLHTTLGSPIFSGRIAAEDAPTVAAIRAAGGIVIGKTNVPELLQGGTSRNTLYGVTRNAHDPSLSCLGSSGGSAVALAASMVPLATGSDMGGSIRGPSAGNGISGLRPSPGLVARTDLPIGFDVSMVLGPMARSTKDVMLLLAGMICSTPLDVYDWNPDIRPLLNPVAADAKNLKIAVSADLGCVEVESSIRAKFEETVCALAPYVGRIDWVAPDFGAITHAFYMLRSLSYLITYGETHLAAPDSLTPEKNIDLRRGFAASAPMIAQALREQTQAFRTLAGLLQNYDVLLTPGASEPLPTLEEVDRREAALRAQNECFALDQYDFDLMPKANINTPITWTAHPVATIPAGRGRDGLPFGINLIGRLRDDIRLLRIALAFEDILGATQEFGSVTPDLSQYERMQS